MAWLRKMPMYAVVLLISAVLIAGAGLVYYAVATFGSTVVTGQLNSGGSGEPYEWNGQRLILQSVDSVRDSTCVITGPDGARRSLGVPRNTTRGMFNSPDFVEVAPQPGITATIICSRTVRVSAGDSAVARTRTVNSHLFRAGMPALVAIPVLLAVGIPLLRRTRGGQAAS
ncbi:MAG: hypothetical protein ACRDRX_24985 [Pseudonocardiaceae bacterium]